jgi:hypothetical protein
MVDNEVSIEINCVEIKSCSYGQLTVSAESLRIQFIYLFVYL